MAAPVLHAAFVPFGTMTARQQAEHLVLAHGFNTDYFGGFDSTAAPEADCETDADIISRMNHVWSARQRSEWHDSDHEYLAGEPGVLACEHTHDKGTARDGGIR